ncbi:MAG TPA: hypothetical protein VEP66_06265 [Myxococcales bacterium]|nr:hypothetical protein [Myxococcales bacterium]
MRRILIATTILAAACGKKSIPATPEIKASVAQARLGLSSASTNTQAIVGLQSVASTLAGAVASGSLASVDLTAGLSDPASLAMVALAPPQAGFAQDLRLPETGVSALAVPVLGCLRSGPGGPTLDAAGQSGCGAADHLEVTFDTGDRMNITWSEASTSFDLAVSVVAGSWSGTDLRYTGASNSSGVAVTAVGAMKYAKSGGPVQVDADFDLTYAVSGSQSATDAVIGVSVNGTATDRLALVRANERWTLNVQTNSGGETLIMDWIGTVGVELLQADGSTKDHSIAFNLNLHGLSQASGANAAVTWSVLGDLQYDAAQVGTLVIRNNLLSVHWTDGAEDPFDVSVLFGSFAV